MPVLAPPPRPLALPESPRVNPFDKSGFEQQAQIEQFSKCTNNFSYEILNASCYTRVILIMFFFMYVYLVHLCIYVINIISL